MNNLPAGAKDDPRAPWNNEKEFECNVCGTSIESQGICNSRDCIKTDNM